ncbi:hypothetical protein FRC04_000489 [Tulasnella sp. 424]|nr:hypothetical protein FRC04_000489 [Tulasnella sp. 424]KAG8973873.1 hypothetical protein FRC05_008094 [Tulasnella sp. 425]
MSKKPTIAVIGSLNYDLVTRVPRLPDLGETLTAKSFTTNCGGKGANQAVAAARLADRCEKVDVKMVGAVGDDGFGKAMKDELKKHGVDVEDVRAVEGMSSGVAVIVVDDATGDNRIMITPGANGALTPSSLPSWLFVPSTAPDLIVLQLEIPLETVQYIITRSSQVQPRIPIILNPAPAVPLDESIYPQVEILIVNESEAALLSGVNFNVSEEGAERQDVLKQKAKEAVDWFVKRGARDVVITLGAYGAYFYDHQSGDRGWFNAHHITNVVDSTGAGDTFVGAIAFNYAGLKHAEREFCIEGGVSVATDAAGWSVQRSGTWQSMPLGKDLQKPPADNSNSSGNKSDLR